MHVAPVDRRCEAWYFYGAGFNSLHARGPALTEAEAKEKARRHYQALKLEASAATP